ncbi:MAG: TetR/AcrR family transcriptional regulator [Lachnospiraceae bacterium]|nr:TetR/AcrR family transcriptional regulator [Lachnospiraceae bacterium]
MKDNITRTSHYIRTDKAIVSAFCKLLKTKTYESITIQDILDETPISRAAFYQHFTDKEAIAEQMMDVFLETKQEIMNEMLISKESQYTKIVSAHLSKQEELLTSLMKINTEKVNIRSVIAQDAKSIYLKESKSKYRMTEACVYAQALTEFQLTSIQNESPVIPGDPSYYNDVMLNVFLKLMNWSDRTDIRNYLYNQLPKE